MSNQAPRVSFEWAELNGHLMRAIEQMEIAVHDLENMNIGNAKESLRRAREVLPQIGKDGLPRYENWCRGVQDVTP
jgi:hypothetical protein